MIGFALQSYNFFCKVANFESKKVQNIAFFNSFPRNWLRGKLFFHLLHVLAEHVVDLAVALDEYLTVADELLATIFDL